MCFAMLFAAWIAPTKQVSYVLGAKEFVK